MVVVMMIGKLSTWLGHCLAKNENRISHGGLTRFWNEANRISVYGVRS